MYHVITDTLDLETFMAGGRLPKPTLSDDYLTIDGGDGGGVNSLRINEEALITEAALVVSNGYVYVTDNVLNPLIETVFNRLEESNDYALFRELMQVTTWKDSLNTIYDTVYDGRGLPRLQKRNYTVLGVTDAVYAAQGIRSIADLAAKVEASSNNYSDTGNELFQYAAYHILNGFFPLSDMTGFDAGATTRLMATKAVKVLQVSREEDGGFYLNYGGGEEKRAQFVETKGISDIEAKNGMVHRVDAWLPAWESTIPVEVLWDLTNYPEVASYIRTTPDDPKQQYQTMHKDAEFKTNITTVSCYEVFQSPSGTLQPDYSPVTYFTVRSNNEWGKTTANSGPCQFFDQLILNLGHGGWISMKSPVVIAGKYKVELGLCHATSMDFMRKMDGGSTGGTMEFSFDGEKKLTISPQTKVPENKLDLYPTIIYDELLFETTAAHTLKIVIQDPAASTNKAFRIQLDYIKFIPIVEEVSE
jgi:uncharacterized surface protein with fasciclin (FAS1) repeats